MDIGKWRGLFDWSMRYADGTAGSNFSEMPQDKRAWLLDALQHYMQDFADRMKEIKKALDDKDQQLSESSLQEKEELLEELTDIVSSIDFARDLHKIGGLSTLLDLLSCPHPSLRWRAAEVVATCVQNNPPVQQWFMDGGIMPPLRALLHDDTTTCRTKALLALSGMMRHFAPAREEFLKNQGMVQLVQCAGMADARLIRKAVSLLHYLCQKDPALGVLARDSGVVPALLRTLDQEDSGIRQAALEVLLDLARIPDTWTTLHEDATLLPKLQQLQSNFRRLSTTEQEDDAEEFDLCEALKEALKQRPDTCPATQNDDIDPATASTSQDALQRHTQSIGLGAESTSQPVQQSGNGGSSAFGREGQVEEQQPVVHDGGRSDSGTAELGAGNGGVSWGLVPVPDYDPR